MSSANTPRHPIRVVAQRSGLTPATLRAWERRYGVVEPGRSEGGQRLYSDDDVLRLTRLRLLTEAGRSISSVAELSDEEVEALLREDRESLVASTSVAQPEGDSPAEVVQTCMRLTLRLDETGLERELRRTAVTLGAATFLEGVVVPLVRRVGVGWARGELRPAHEHLCTTVVTSVLNWLTESFARTTPIDARRLLVTTLPGERHGLGALLVAAVAALEGWQVINLGTDLPPLDIAQAAVSVGVRAVALSVVHVPDPAATTQDLVALRTAVPADTTVIVGGQGLAALSGLPPGTVEADGLGALRKVLADLS